MESGKWGGKGFIQKMEQGQWGSELSFFLYQYNRYTGAQMI